jgi:ADP-ribose pyrophosphatase YjhB (NUDIX family)
VRLADEATQLDLEDISHMWLITPFGFFSVVRKPGDAHLTVRARVAADLDALRSRYAPALGPTVTGAGTDYPYRATIDPDAWADALARMGRDIDYANFKDEVKRRQGSARAHAYAKVWSALTGLEEEVEKPRRRPEPAVEGPVIHPKPGRKGKDVEIERPSKPTALSAWADARSIATVVPEGPMPLALHGVAFAKWTDAPRTDAAWERVAGQRADLDEKPLKQVTHKPPAAGVVVIEPDDRVWIVSPTNGYGGYANTFPKGKLEGGHNLQALAIREGFEESGLRVEILRHLVDSERDTSMTRFYLARRVGGTPADMGWEAQAVHLVPRERLKARERTKAFVGHANDAVVVQAILALPAFAEVLRSHR